MQPKNKYVWNNIIKIFMNFRKALKAGSSIHWKKVLYILTGSDEIKSDALLEYYAPLIKWLRQFLEINKIAY